MTSWTPGSPSSREASTRPSLPTSPTAVRCEPGIGCARYPISWITATTRWTSASVAPCRITISTLASSDPEPIPVLGGRHGPLEPGPRLPRRVRSFYRWIEVGQDEPLGPGPAGEQPLAVPLRQRLHEPDHAGRAEDDERLLPRRHRRVLQRVHEHRQLGPVVRVEVGQDDVGDLGPR